MSDVTEIFRAAMAAHGVVVNGEIIADGELHRCHVEGDRAGSRNGWYCLHIDDHPAGEFGDWKRNVKATWKSNGTTQWTAADIEAVRRRNAERESERAVERAAAAGLASRIWAASVPVSTHDYFDKKGVGTPPTSVRSISRVALASVAADVFVPGDGDLLVVPVFQRTNGVAVLTSLGFINKSGEKRFLEGGSVRGGFCMVGDVASADVVAISGGFATGMSVHTATGWLTAIAFFASNLLAVAKAIRAQFPLATIVIAADRDESQVGETCGAAAAAAVRGLLAISPVASDWNDLQSLEGCEAVAAGLHAVVEQAASEQAPGSGAGSPPRSERVSPTPAGARAARRLTSAGLDPTALEDAVNVIAEGRQIAETGVPYLLRLLIPAFGMLGMLVAFTRVGKTTFGQQIAAAIATGRPFLGLDTRQTRVLIIAAEDPSQYTAFLSRHLDVPEGVLTFYRRSHLLDAAGLDAITTTVKNGGYGLVLIASWQAVVRGLIRDENDNAASVVIVENVKAAARLTKIPWLIDAHSGKGEDQGDDADPSKAMRGASSAVGAADYMLSLRYANGPFGSRRRLSGKGRFVDFAPMLLDYDKTHGTYTVIGSSEAKDVMAETTWRLIVDTDALTDVPQTADAIARAAGLVGKTGRVTSTGRRQVGAALFRRDDVRMTIETHRGQQTKVYARLKGEEV